MTGRVLIVDTVSTNRIVLRVKLAAAFFETVLASNAAEALRCLDDPGVSLAIIAMDLPDRSGIELCRQIRTRHPAGTLPIIVLAAGGYDTGPRLDALQSGADEVLDHPVNETLLLARVRCLMRGREGLDDLRLREGSHRALGLEEPAADFAGPGRIAVMATQPGQAADLRDALAARHSHMITVLDRADLIQTPPDSAMPDLGIVLLTGRADDPGLHLIAALRAQSETRAMEVLALMRDVDPILMAQALNQGASDVMADLTSEKEMDLRIDRLLQAKRRADRLRDHVHDGLRAAVTDALTGLHNRRYALPQLARMVRTAHERGEGVAVMVADLDHFKRVNDRYGHAVGDAVLRHVARRLRVNLRPGDLLARIGGEEFLIAMSGLTRDAAQDEALRLCRAVSDTPVTVPGCAAPLPVTISIGVAISTASDPAFLPETVLDQADRALFSAKTRGRNTVTLDQSAA